MDNVSLIPVPSGGFGETARLQTAGQIDKMEFSLDFRRNHLKRRSFLGLRPHILGLISIFNGKPLKIEEKESCSADDILQAKIYMYQ